MKRLALLISGGGTTATSILNSCKGPLNGLIEPAILISSNPNAKGLNRTLATGMLNPEDQVIIDPKEFGDQESFGQAIMEACNSRGVDIIGQYGWMALTPQNVIDAFENRMINQHPGPIDPGHLDFGGSGMYGKRVHCARLLFVREIKRDFWTEATAQRVDKDWDKGAILKTERVPILPCDDVDDLQGRVLEAEYRVQIATLSDFANGVEKEIVRSERLIQPIEEGVLYGAKRIARMLYPKV